MSRWSRHAALGACAFTLLGATACASRAAVITTAPPAAAASATQPTLDPSHGGKAAAWTVIAPELVPVIGGTPVHDWPHCTASQVTAHATTRLIPGGVAGLVHLHGDHCTIYSHGGPDELRSGDTTLAVGATPWSKQAHPLDTPRSDIPRDDGNLIWSFTWTGSWCGATATSIVVPLVEAGGDVVAPLAGPQPTCATTPTTSASRLTPGAPSRKQQPDLGPSPAWDGLRLHLKLPSHEPDGVLQHVRAKLRNTTATAIAIAPCPTYATVVRTKHSEQTVDPYDATFPCHYQPRSIPAHSTVTVHLPSAGYDPRGTPHSGQRLTVTLGIEGFDLAVAHTRVR